MVDQEEAVLVEVRVGIDCKSLALVGTQMAELVVGILVVERKEREVENKYFGLVGYKDHYYPRSRRSSLEKHTKCHYRFDCTGPVVKVFGCNLVFEVAEIVDTTDAGYLEVVVDSAVSFAVMEVLVESVLQFVAFVEAAPSGSCMLGMVFVVQTEMMMMLVVYRLSAAVVHESLSVLIFAGVVVS